MHFVIDWNMIISLGILALIGFIAKQLWCIKLELVKLTTQMNGVEIWQTSHEKLDDDRHTEVQDRLAGLDRVIHQIREGE